MQPRSVTISMGGPAFNQEGPQDSVKKFLLNSKNSRGGRIRGDFQREFEGGVGFEISRENSRAGG